MCLGILSLEAARFLKSLSVAGYKHIYFGLSRLREESDECLMPSAGFVHSDQERFITNEDSAGLQIKGIENLVRLEGALPIRTAKMRNFYPDLIKSSLRMRPDRIVSEKSEGDRRL